MVVNVGGERSIVTVFFRVWSVCGEVVVGVARTASSRCESRRLGEDGRRVRSGSQEQPDSGAVGKCVQKDNQSMREAPKYR